jgi:putative flippase GtrA
MCYNGQTFMRPRDYVITSVLAGFSALLIVPILLHTNVLPFKLSSLLIFGFILGIILLEDVALFVCGVAAHYFPFMRKLARFSSAGVFNTILDTSILNGLIYIFKVYAGPSIVAFNLVSFCITLVISYFINRTWSFETAVKPHTKEFSLFIMVVLGSLAINSALIFYLTTIMTPPQGISPVSWVIFAKLLTAIVSMLWNFIGFHFIVFRKEHISHEPEKI